MLYWKHHGGHKSLRPVCNVARRVTMHEDARSMHRKNCYSSPDIRVFVAVEKCYFFIAKLEILESTRGHVDILSFINITTHTHTHTNNLNSQIFLLTH